MRIDKKALIYVLVAISCGYISFLSHYNDLISLGFPILAYISLASFESYYYRKPFKKVAYKYLLLYFATWYLSYTIFFNVLSTF
ncbi:MAG: hypothetical protein QXQ14_03080 [Candidatus Aenigmatarchaeota archaeon]